MDKRQIKFWSGGTNLLIVFCLAVVSGGLYYLLYRWQGNALANHWQWFDNFRGGLNDPTGGALPSLLHMLALGCLSAALLDVKRGANLTFALLLMTLAAERTLGVFDWADVFFAVIGALLAIVLASSGVCSNPAKAQLPRRQTAMAGAALVACSSLFIGATTPCLYCDSDYRSSKPVYLSYTDLRSGVSIDTAREVNEIGRIYLYGDYIFLNKRNQGIHVLDNTDPENPVNELFISIPGNTELSIRGNYLYADSYVDLVTLDLNNPADIQVVDRQIDVFPWDEYQNVPDDIYFYFDDIDQTRGVIVSYER